MGTSLTGNNISASYLGLLKSTDSQAIGSTVKRITDGGGNDLPLDISTSTVRFRSGTIMAPGLSIGSNSEGFYVPSDENIGFVIAGSEKIRLNSDGLSVLNSKLTLNNDQKVRWTSDDVYIQGTTASDNIQLGVGGSTQFTFAQTTGMRLHQYGSGNITGTVTQRLGVTSAGQVVEIPIGSGAVDGSGTAGKIVKWSDSDTITDSVISESSGNIQIQGLLGVGLVPDSAVQLSVNGQIGTSNNGNAGAPDFTFYGDDNTGMYRVGADSLGFTTGGTNALTFDSSQNSTFAGGITVAGNDAQFNHNIVLEGSVFHKDDTNTSFGFPADDTISFSTAGSERARLDSNGRLGLGQTSMTYALEVINSTYDNIAWGGSSAVGVLTQQGSNPAFRTVGDLDIVFYANNNLQLTIDDGSSTFAGNVTINKTANPTSLQIGSSLADDPFLVFQSDGNTMSMGIDRSDSNKFVISDNATLGTNNRLTIDTSGDATFAGKVQVGAISSGTLNENTGVKLAIIGDSGDTNDGLIITRDNGSQNQLDQFINIYHDGTSSFLTSGGTSTHGSFDFRSTNDKGDTSTSRLSIDASGNATFAGAITTTGTLTVNSGHINLDAGLSISWDNTHERIEQSDSNLEFFTNNSQSMTLSSSNLGIGTTSPSAKLEISHTDTMIRMSDSDGTNQYLELGHNNGSSTYVSRNNTSMGTHVFYTANGTSTTERLRISSAGDTTFSGDMSMVKDVPSFDFVDSNSDSDFRLRNNNGVFEMLDTTNSRTLMSLTSGAVITLDSLGSNTVLNTSGSVVVPNGSVGIGTTSPIGKFNIQQSVLDTPFLFSGRYNSENEPILQMGESTAFSGSNSFGELLIHSYNRDIVFSTQSDATFSDIDTPIMILEKSNGNVGIGTASPATKLEVEGSTNGIITMSSTSGTGGRMDFAHSGSNYGNVGSARNLLGTGNASDMMVNGNSVLYLGVGAQTITVTGSGNVGIGDTAPNDTLHVQGDVKIVSGVQKTPLFEVSSFIGGHTGDVAYIHCATPSSTGYNLLHVQGDSDDTPIEALVVRGDGNVGIGNSNPSRPLDITSDSGAVALKLRARSANDFAFISFTQNDGGGTIWAELAGMPTGLRIDTNGSEKMRISSDGNVGINKTAPNNKLHVHGGGIDISSFTNNAGFVMDYGNATGTINFMNLKSNGVSTNIGQVQRQSPNEADLFLGGSGGKTMTLTSGNNVGIGTDSPDARFSVVTATANSTASRIGGLEYSGTQRGLTIKTFQSNGGDDCGVEFNAAEGLSGYGSFIFKADTAERLRIANDGVIQNATINSSTASAFKISNNAGSANFTYGMTIEDDSSNTGFILFAQADGTAVGSITRSGTSTVYATSSDYRLKEDLKDFNALEIASKIKMYDFKWNSNNTRDYGVIAHELQEVFPQAVVGEKDGENMQGVDYSKLVPILLKSIQELEARVKELEKEI